MGSESPDVVLYDVNGVMMGVQNATSIPANTSALLFAGSDGTNSRYITVNSSGDIVIVGAGTAGTPTGGVLTIQGVSGGTNVPVSQGTSPWVDNITQFGGTNVSTGTGASGAGIPRVTVSNDSNILATQSGTWTTTVTQTTASNLNATVVGLGAAGSSSGGILSTQVPDTTNTGTLGAANANVAIALNGTYGVGFQLAAGTLVGTIVPEISYDGGTTWVNSFFADPTADNKVSSIVFGANNTATSRSVIAPPGASNARVRVSAYTSGTANASIRSSTIIEPPPLFSGSSGVAAPPSIAQVGGNDGTNLHAFLTDSSGHPIIVGSGTAGTPSGGVITIQGVSGGTNVPVSQGTSPWVDNITQFGGTNVSTGTGAGGAGIPRVTVSNDSNILSTQSGSWTVTANQGTANTLANAWPEKLTDGTNGPVAVKPASTAAVATDPALVVAISPNNSISIAGSADSTNSGTLAAANANVQLAVTGENNAGMQLASGTLVGTIVPEISMDGGTTWVGTFFADPSTGNLVSSIVFGSSNTATTRTIVGVGGSSHVRVRVSAYTSGTTTCSLRASIMQDSVLLSNGSSGGVLPPSMQQMGGSVTTSAPTYSNSTLNALSLTTVGALRIDGSAVNQPVLGAQTSETTAAWTSATTVNTTAAITVTGYSTVAVALNQGSTITGGVITFEVSDTSGGTNWYPVSVISSFSAVPTSTYTLTASINVAFQINISGFVQFRIRLSTVISGTATVNVGLIANNNPVNTQQEQFTLLTDGTNGPVAVKAASTAAVATDPALVVAISPNNSISIAGSADSTNSGTLGALNANVQLAVTGENNAGMQLASGTLVGTIVAEASVDGGTTWVSTFFDDPTTSNVVSSIVFASSNTATTRTIIGVGGASHVRIRVSAYTSGSTTCSLRASIMQDPSLLSNGAAGSGLPPSIQQIGGSVTTSAPTYSNSTFNALSLTTAGAVRVDGSGINQPVLGAQTSETTAAWTSSTAVNSTAAITVTGYSTVAIAVNQGSTITGGVITFEISDTSLGTNWYPVSIASSFTAVPTSTYTLVASTNVAFQVNISGMVQFRVRLSTVISGTATVNIGLSANNNPANTQQEEFMLLTDGTNGPVAVKAASIAAVATDPALVVAISPNSNKVQGQNSGGSTNTGNPILIGGQDQNSLMQAVSATNLNGLIHLNVIDVISANKLDTIILLLYSIKNLLANTGISESIGDKL